MGYQRFTYAKKQKKEVLYSKTERIDKQSNAQIKKIMHLFF